LRAACRAVVSALAPVDVPRQWRLGDDIAVVPVMAGPDDGTVTPITER
jgi:hypothetical protein